LALYLHLPTSVNQFLVECGSHNNFELLLRHWGTQFIKTTKIYDPLHTIVASVEPLKLLELPEQFHDLFRKYLNKQCPRCHTKPGAYAAMCLFCGQYLCANSSCCRSDGAGECYQHMVRCGAGSGVFLMLQSSAIIIMSDEKCCFWGSPYFDQFGEEDLFFSRGKPLFLSLPVYELLGTFITLHKLDDELLRADIPNYKKAQQSKLW